MKTFTTRPEAEKELENIAKEKAFNYLRTELEQFPGIFKVPLLKLFRMETASYKSDLSVVFEPSVKSYIVQG